MEIIPKQGYLLVELIQESERKSDLDSNINSGKIVSGAINDKGVTIFFGSWIPFSAGHVLVKVDDVLAWIKPEEKVDEQADNA
jgi:hypothetical protein